MSDDALPQPGRVARDRDDPEAAVLVLETLPETRADEYDVESTGRTIYDYNPDYPPWAPVVRAVYISDLDAMTAWRDLDELEALVDRGDLRAYAFPARRLAPLGRRRPRAAAGGGS